MRLDVALVRPRDGVRSFENVRRFRERRLRVAEFRAGVLRDVGRRYLLAQVVAHEVVVDDDRVRLHRVFQADDRLERLVLNLDELQRFQRRVLVDGGDRRDRVPAVDGLAVRHDALAGPLEVGHLLHHVHDLGAGDRHVVARDGGKDAGRSFGAGDVHPLDDGVRVRAAQHRAVDEARQFQVRAVLGTAQHLVDAVVPDGAAPHHLELL